MHMRWKNWLFFPFSRVRGIRAYGLMGLMLLWQVVNAVGFLWEAIEQKLGGDVRESPSVGPT